VCFTNESLQVPNTSANLRICNLQENQLMILCDCGFFSIFFSLFLSARNKSTQTSRDKKVKGQERFHCNELLNTLFCRELCITVMFIYLEFIFLFQFNSWPDHINVHLK